MASCTTGSTIGMAVKFYVVILSSVCVSAEVNRTVPGDWVIETKTGFPPTLFPPKPVKLDNDSFADGNETVLSTTPHPLVTEFYAEAIPFPPPLVIVCPSCMPPFEGGADFYHSVTKWNNLACGGSVCNKTYKINECGPFLCDRCECDPECVHYGDCCPDIFIRVPRVKPDAKLSCISQAFIPLNPSAAERYANYLRDIHTCFFASILVELITRIVTGSSI